MSENNLSYRIDLDDEPLWNDIVDRVQRAESCVFVSHDLDAVPAELTAESNHNSPSQVTYFASPAAIAADVDSTQPFWPMAFPLMKRQAVVAIPSRLLDSVERPDSQSDLLLQLSALDESVEVVATRSLGFDVMRATLPLADSGHPADAKVSEVLRREGSTFADVVCAGLLLANGEDDASHRVSQSFEGESDFDYWHGLMHRREPDYGNASYWFRRVGDHAAFDDLPAMLQQIRETVKDIDFPATFDGEWSAFDAIDLFRRAADQPGSHLERVARLVQQAELCNLLRYVSAI